MQARTWRAAASGKAKGPGNGDKFLFWDPARWQVGAKSTAKRGRNTKIQARERRVVRWEGGDERRDGGVDDETRRRPGDDDATTPRHAACAPRASRLGPGKKRSSQGPYDLGRFCRVSAERERPWAWNTVVVVVAFSCCWRGDLVLGTGQDRGHQAKAGRGTAAEARHAEARRRGDGLGVKP